MYVCMYVCMYVYIYIYMHTLNTYKPKKADSLKTQSLEVRGEDIAVHKSERSRKRSTGIYVDNRLVDSQAAG